MSSILLLKVAQHLANTYGDRAFSVAKLTRLTGKRWPIVGKRLHEEYPYIDAEVRHSIRVIDANVVLMYTSSLKKKKAFLVA